MRRRTKEIPACLLLLSAAAVTVGCREQRRDCVDAAGHKMPDSTCATGARGGAGSHYVYGGRSGGRVGDTVEGGSVSRGGFGSGEGSGGDGGDGGEGGEGGSHGGSGGE